MVVLNLFHIFATTVDSTAVEKNLLIMKFYNREKEIAELKRVQELAFFFKQKTAYVIPKRDWSSDVCSSDLVADLEGDARADEAVRLGGHVGLEGQIGRASCRERV